MSTEPQEHTPEQADGPWQGFSQDEALRWNRVLIRHSPDPLRAGIKAQMHESIKRGVTVTGRDWVRTAAVARADGFTPVLYQTLLEALKTIDSRLFRSHPAHRRTTFRPSVPGTPYESELWEDWPRLFLAKEFDARTAATLVLLRTEPLFPDPRRPQVE